MCKIKYIYLLLILLFPLSLVSQKNKDKKRKKIEKEGKAYYDRIFGDDDSMFQLTECPTNYKEASSVVLASKVHIAFLKNSVKEYNLTKVVLRKRILLNDATSVKEFSEFHYHNSEYVGISHIKKGEKSINIDLSKAVKVSTDIPNRYKDRFHNESYFKIAIANLEIGDIIDFHKVFKQGYQTYIELNIPLASTEPIIKQEIIFDVDKKWTLYYDGFNGADNFEIDPKGGFDQKGRRRKTVKRISFKSNNDVSHGSERWNYEFLHIPHIKIMAVPPNSFLYSDKAGLLRGLDPKKTLTRKRKSNDRDYLKDYIDLFKLKEIDADQAIEFLYKSIRSRYLKIGDPNSWDYFANDFTRKKSFNGNNGNGFAYTFAETLKEFNFDVEVIMAMPKFAGKLDDLVNSEDVVFGVYIKELDKYYWPISEYSRGRETPGYIEGADAIKILYSEMDKKNPPIESITIPYSSVEDNVYESNISVKVRDNLTTDFNIDILMTGNYRSIYSPMFLSDTYYLEEERDLYRTEKEKKRKKEKEREAEEDPSDNYLKRKAERIDKEKAVIKKKKEIVEAWVNDYYKVTEMKSYEVLKNGIMNDDGVLQVKYDFISDEYVKKAGPNLIFDLGSLIGEQVQLTTEEISLRKHDVNSRNPRLITNDITVEIPEGLVAKGLEDLVFNIENEYGGFVSTATQEGNRILVSTTKTYAMAHIPAEKWSNMVAFLEAAYKFTQTKVILKKQD